MTFLIVKFLYILLSNSGHLKPVENNIGDVHLLFTNNNNKLCIQIIFEFFQKQRILFLIKLKQTIKDLQKKGKNLRYGDNTLEELKQKNRIFAN